MKQLLTLLLAICMASTSVAQGITEVGATETILPATRYTQEQWTVPTYNLRLGETFGWGVDYPVLGTPPTDTHGREWYDPSYTLTNGKVDWQDRTAPFSSSMWYNGMRSTSWASGDEPADLYFRRTFTTTISKRADIYLACGYDDSPCEYYLNGTLIFQSEYGWNENAYMQLTTEQKALLHTDGTKNVFAVHMHNNYGGSYADVGLYYVPFEDSDMDADIASSIIISEVQNSNIDQFIDNSFNYGNWIELYNKSDKRISLGNIFVSDDPEQLNKFMLPASYGVIQPGAYKNIYFDHNAADGTYGPNATKQVNFKLKTDGGTIYLSEDGVTAFATIDYPAAIARCSYARRSMGNDEWEYNAIPTPEQPNADAYASQRLEAPVVDTDSHLFTSPFSVNVTIPQGATLRYTTDGTTPSLTNGLTSTDGHFTISQTTSLRLCLFQQGMLPSQVVTRSYIYRDKDYYLPVIAITTNPDNLYDDIIGVYVDGTNGVDGRNHGKSNINMDWERPVNFEYITPDGKMGVNMEAEFSISGGWSRHYAPASFKIKASKLYEGVNSIDYPFFPLKPHNKYKQILIRNGGNDNDSWSHGRVRDAITQQVLMSSGFYVDAQDYQPTHVFFNGQYVGMLNLREPNNRYNGTANYGYDEDEMDAFEYSNGYFQMAGTREAFDEWVSLAENAADNNTYEELRQKVDMDEVINYFAAISYIGCSDWICNNNNSKGYRSLPDGKFHLTLLDQDWGWSNQDGVSRLEGQYYNELLSIYNGMKQNPQFQRQFVDTYSILHGSVFTPERCQAINDSICALVAPALAFEGRTPYNSANEQIGNMTSAGTRANRIDALRNAYGLSNGMTITLSANIPQASFSLNGLTIPTRSFSGKMFAPANIETSAPAGFLFKGWQTNDSQQTEMIPWGDKWAYYDKGSLDGTSWKTASTSSWDNGYAPLGYGKSQIVTTIGYGGDAANKYPTYYFRRNVYLKDKPAADDVIEMNFVADDGFVVYVNGTEAGRYNLPEGEITYDTFAPTFAQNNPDSGTMLLNPQLFTQGTNKIAVEVHNNVPGSSDIYWDAQMQLTHEDDGIILSTDRLLQLTEERAMKIKAVYEPLPEEILTIAGQTPVVINEVSAANTVYVNDHYKRNDWVELYNTTNEDIDIAGMYLSDNPERPEKFQITAADTEASTIIPAHGFLIVWADKLDPMFQLHSGFKLGNEDGESVTITAKDGSWSNTLEYVSHTGVETVGRFPDGGSRIYKMTHPTIAAANQLTTYAEWISGENKDFDLDGYLTEIASHPDASDVTHAMEYYTIDGIRLNAPQHGINIVRLPDGTTRKVVIK